MAKRVKKQQKVEEIEVGSELISWETWEYPPYDRTKWWYVIAGIVGGSLILYAVLSANYLFAIIVLMMGVIILVNTLRHPERITVYITNLGVVVGTDFYPYKEIKDFSIIFDPPDVKILYVDFNSMWRPLIAVPLEVVNPNLLRDAILPYAFENLERENEHLTDLVRRLYKL